MALSGNEDIQHVIAVNIRAERARKNFRQVDLAAKSKVAPSGIAAIEGGQRNAHVATLRAIAEAFGIPLYTLVLRHADRDYSRA